MSAPVVTLLAWVGPDGGPALASSPSLVPDGATLLVVDHHDDAPARPGVEHLHARTLSRTAALADALRRVRTPFVLVLGAGAAVDGALGALSDLLVRHPGAGAATCGYRLVTAEGRDHLPVDPSLDGDNPPPGWLNFTLFRTEILASIGADPFVSPEIQLYRSLRAAGQLVHDPRPLGRMSLDAFALERAANRREHHLPGVRTHRYEDDTPLISIIVSSAGEPAALRRTLLALGPQVMPVNTYEVIVAEDAGAPSVVGPLLDGYRSEVVIEGVVGAAPGRGAAVIAAVQAARGLLLLFLEAGTLPAMDVVEHHVRAHRSFLPREVVVIGSWETPAADQRTALGRLLERSELVRPTADLLDGAFIDPARVHLANTSVPRELFARCAHGLDQVDGLAVERLLGHNLASAGHRVLVHLAARAYRPPGMDLAALARHRERFAQDRIGLVAVEPSLLDNPHGDPLSVEALEARLAAHAPGQRAVRQAAEALGRLDVAAFEPIDDHWRNFADEAVDRLEPLVRHLDALWRASGARDALVAAGVDAVNGLLRRNPALIPGARSRVFLLIPRKAHDGGWVRPVVGWLRHVPRDADETLVLLATGGADYTVDELQAATRHISAQIEPPAAGGWAHMLVLDQALVLVPLARMVAGLSAWVRTGAPEDAELEAIAAPMGVPAVDPVAGWPVDPGPPPWPVPAAGRWRFFAPVDWSDGESLRQTLGTWVPALAPVAGVTLCLAFRPEDGDPDDALARLGAAWEEAVPPDIDLEVSIFTPPDSPADAARFARSVHGVLGAAGPWSALVEAAGLPVLGSHDALGARLSELSARDPGPYTPVQVYLI